VRFNRRDFQSYHYQKNTTGVIVGKTDAEKSDPDIQGLIARSIAGDLGAFRSLMESQQRYAYAVAFRLLHDDEGAKDIVQEAFIRVWNNISRYRPESRFTTWLYKIVVNLCYDRMKMESRRKSVFGSIGGLFGGAEIADSRDPEQEAEDTDLREHILSAAKRLPPKQRLVFLLRDIQDLSIEDIAEIGRMSVGSVKTNLCYARRVLRIAVTKLSESGLS
jgi:RNA polymerase sigma-70 factor (ECF subfamily)